MKKTIFDNCSVCKFYRPVNSEGICLDCFEAEQQALELTIDYLHEHPHATGEDAAQALNIPFQQVEEWIRDGKIRCIVFEAQCPNCGKSLVNEISCERCGESLAPKLSPPPKKTYRRITALERREGGGSLRERRRKSA